jgi:hypothetical protein
VTTFLQCSGATPSWLWLRAMHFHYSVYTEKTPAAAVRLYARQPNILARRSKALEGLLLQLHADNTNWIVKLLLHLPPNLSVCAINGSLDCIPNGAFEKKIHCIVISQGCHTTCYMLIVTPVNTTEIIFSQTSYYYI